MTTGCRRTRHPRLARLLWPAAMALLAMHPLDTTAQSLAPPFSKCVAAAAQWSYTELLCIYQVGAQHQRLAAARKNLRQLGAGRPTYPWATLVLGHATLNDDEPQAVRHYEAAADAFHRMGEAEGEVIARQNLRFLYLRRGNIEVAGRQVTLAREAAETSNAPLAIVRASVLEAAHILEAGGDVGHAHRTLLRAERFAFPNAPIALRRAVLFNLANANLYLGRLDDAITVLERHRGLRAEDGATTDAAPVAFNLLNAHVTQAELRPSASDRARLLQMAEQVVAEIQRLNRPYAEAQAQRLLGDLLRPTDRARAATHLRRCLELEAPFGYPEIRASCLWSLAVLEASANPSQAEAWSREAIRLTSANSNSVLLPFAWQARLRLVWHTLPQRQAIVESFAALDAIERLRARQEGNAARAALFHNWTRDYYWLTGRLLQAEPPQVERAFEAGERLRARVLLEHLAHAGVTRADANDVRDGSRQQLTRRITDTQRRLLVPALVATERRALLDHLELLELERGESGDGDVPAVDPRTLPFASLDAVQRALHPHEAMLWFSIGAWKDLYDDFGGGAWVFAVTRDGVRLHRLATAVALDSQVAALTGLLRQRDTRDTAWSAAAESLGHSLLSDAVAGLPAGIERLVIVSDGVLHRLPFEVLHADDRTTQTLGERFEVSVVPSATLWLRLRDNHASISPGGTLVLADPEVPRGTGIGDLPLTPLPWARREGAAVARILHLEAAAVHQGSAASERALKDAARGAYAVVHFAAHARADGAFPERSAVFLAPGAVDEDGWLQPREIAALNLRGSLVVLSACESADGALLSGEGPLSLARAFFAAGASVVVATRWPLRDDDVAFFMERFYRELATGASVGRALGRARRDAITSGRPAALWAGVALLGDGSRTPIRVPASRWHSTMRWRVALATTIVIIGITVACTARRRR
jgi:CHAT domain-containing protein